MDYIAEDRPQAAVDWLGELIERIGQLSEFPEIGPTLSEYGRPEADHACGWAVIARGGEVPQLNCVTVS